MPSGRDGLGGSLVGDSGEDLPRCESAAMSAVASGKR